MASHPKTALVIGGTGFIGSHVVESLLADGASTHVFLKNEASRAKLLPAKDIVAHVVDITDSVAVEAAYKEIAPEEIYHLAMSPMQMGHIGVPRELIETNVLGTATLMDALSVVPESRFVYAGSFTEVGGKDEPIRENHLAQPPELYNVTKLAGTLYGQALARTKGLQIVVGRVFTPYGPRVQKGRLVDTVIRRALTGEPIALTSRSVNRDFVYVTDVAKMFRELASRAAEFRGEVFNIGTGVSTTLEELVRLVKEVTGSESPVSWNPENQVSYDTFHWQADMSKTHAQLAWRPQYTLDSGLKETIEWMRNNP